MDTATQILVIIVSTLLSLVLVLGIVVLVGVIKLIKQIRHIGEKAEALVDNAEQAASMFTKAAGPIGLFRTILKIIDSVNNHKKGK